MITLTHPDGTAVDLAVSEDLYGYALTARRSGSTGLEARFRRFKAETDAHYAMNRWYNDITSGKLAWFGDGLVYTPEISSD